jgi:nucleoside-diphosphate-sugar epimerase
LSSTKKAPKILITGNMGYVGPVLAKHLRQRFSSATLVGYDSGLFAHCLTTLAGLPERFLDLQIFADIRDLPNAVLADVDAVVALAAISNDPMGIRYESPTADINFRANVELADKASAAGVRSFVFASSCSVYGFAEGGPRKESDALNPLTAYARSKIDMERALAQRDFGTMSVTCLRFATACGMSDRLRLDLVLNDFVASALSTGKISVLSDGTPWRPLIDVHDMARAIEWAITRDPENGGRYLAVNVGSDLWNYQVEDLAAAVANEISGSSYSINRDAPPDKRSYRVDFSLYRSLAPSHQPEVTLVQCIRDLRDGLTAIDFCDPNFRNADKIRLKVLDKHREAGRLTPDLRWNHGGQPAA